MWGHVTTNIFGLSDSALVSFASGAEVDEEERAGSADSASSKSQQQQAAGTKPTISWKSGEVGPQNARLTLKKQEGAELLKAR